MKGQTTALLVIAVALVSWLGREGQGQRPPATDRPGWVTLDPDTQYQLRRVDRVLVEGLPPAARDPYLDYPRGSAIPWPPYYTGVAWALTAPGMPMDEAERRRAVEERVASLPMVFGVATSVLAAAAGGMLAGPVGALIAGGNHALANAAIVYGARGNGDHHAWVSLLALAMLTLLTGAIRRGALDDPRRARIWGAGTGAVAGVALGSWVGSVLHIVPVQLTLGVLVLASARQRLPGLAPFGVAFHLAALVVALPAIGLSPWNVEQPGSVVNLTWFHGAWLAAGGLVFVPWFVPALARRGGRTPVVAAIVVAALAAAALASTSGVREAFVWIGRTDPFMGSVWESRGIGPGEAFGLQGGGLALFPIAWVGAVAVAWRRRRFDLLPWITATAILMVESARQYRFHEPFVAPLSVLLAWGVVSAFRTKVVQRRVKETLPGLRPGRAAWPVAAVLLLVAHSGSVGSTLAGLTGRRPAPDQLSVVVRSLAEWIRTHTPETADYSVLAGWNWGHTIEWAADRPSVGTNFGTYVGEASFRDAGRFLLGEDEAAADSLLAARRARYVLVTGWLPNFLEQMTRAVDPELLERYTDAAPTSGGKRPIRIDWFRTIGARLLFDGSVVHADGTVLGPLGFARVVSVSPERYPELVMGAERPAGWVWERVAGARVEARGAPGDTLKLEIRLRYDRGDYDLSWYHEALADDEGVARLQVPYSTDARSGDGKPTAKARWSIGGRDGWVNVPERAVASGDTVRIG